MTSENKKRMSKLKPCQDCGGKAVIERWSSGGIMYMVKCNNPDCFHPKHYPKGRKLDEVIDKWNRRVSDEDRRNTSTTE